MARRKSKAAGGGIARTPTSAAGRIAHAEALHRLGQDTPDERAQYYVEAAEYYAAAGEHETAEGLFLAALDDGGFVVGGVHSFYADFLFGRDRSDEALAVIEAARKLRPDDPYVFIGIGEMLDEQGRHRDAARWLTRGLVRYYGDLAEIAAEDLEDPEGRMMAADRLRARRNAELAPDHVDEIIAPLIEAVGEIDGIG